MSDETEKPFNVFAALRDRYPLGEYAYMSEVRNGTGFTKMTRYADALVMSTWPSRGLDLMGFEVKISRGDWLRELKDPAKAETIFAYCDRWYLVVSDANIVKDGELPTSWGLLVPRKDKLIAKVEASKLTPKPIDKAFLASLLRNVTEQCVPVRDISERCEARYAEGLKRGAEHGKTDVERLTKEIAHYKRRIESFEQQAKVKLDEYRYGELCEALELVRSGKPENLVRQLEGLASSVESLSGVMKRSAELSRKMLKESNEQGEGRVRSDIRHGGSAGVHEGAAAGKAAGAGAGHVVEESDGA